MTATEKHLRMNHCFIELGDAIFEPNVDNEVESAATSPWSRPYTDFGNCFPPAISD